MNVYVRSNRNQAAIQPSQTGAPQIQRALVSSGPRGTTPQVDFWHLHARAHACIHITCARAHVLVVGVVNLTELGKGNPNRENEWSQRTGHRQVHGDVFLAVNLTTSEIN